MRIVAVSSFACLLLALVACSGGGNVSAVTGGALTGNWQFDLLQETPSPATSLSASGFIQDLDDALTGNLQVPAVGSSFSCGGVSSLNGNVTGSNVTFSLNEGGTILNFTGSASPDGTSMSGDYQGAGGGCRGAPITGTWNAFLIPPLNGNFTGTLSDSSYMATLTGLSPALPIAVSGTITQSANFGASNATLTGTITAVGYPCFATVSLSGTISGQNVYMDVFNYRGEQIGTLGVPGLPGIAGTPATVAVSSKGISLVGAGQSGLALGISGVPACPPIAENGFAVTSDVTSVAFTFQ